MLGYLFKNQSGKIRNMNGKRSSSFPTDVSRTAPNLIPCKYDFIWKKYSQHGYRTLYSEDAPGIQMFDYLKAGFSKFPADYFNRPFSLKGRHILQ
jgi:hypothetical protein